MQLESYCYLYLCTVNTGHIRSKYCSSTRGRFLRNVHKDTYGMFNIHYTIINETARLKWHFLTNFMKMLVTLHSCYLCQVISVIER